MTKIKKPVEPRPKRPENKTASLPAARAPWMRIGSIATAAFVVLIHVVRLVDAPPGTYVDEASIGYNAYCLLQTGADEHGVRWPLFFEAFGEYKNPIFIYATLPLIKIFGLSIWTMRFTAALFALATAVFLALLIREVLESALWAWIGFLVAGTLPWLFTLGRISFEAVSYPCLIALAWWSWVKATKLKSLPWYALSGIAWGLSIFSYSTARLMTPVLVCVLVLSFVGSVKGRGMLSAAIPFAAALLVLLTWGVQHPGSLTGRFEIVSIWHGGVLTGLGKFVGNYAACLSPSFVFLHGDANLRHHSGFGGELFVFCFPALLAGLVYAWRSRRLGSECFALLGFVLFPIAASMTIDPRHALRTLNAVPFAVVLIVFGLRELWQLLQGRRLLCGVFVLFALSETVLYLNDYFTEYPDRAAAWFNRGLADAIRFSLAARNGPLYFSPLAFRDEHSIPRWPEIQFAFEGKLDPAIFRRAGLQGFQIIAYERETRAPGGSLILLKDSEEVRLAGNLPVLLPNPIGPPPGSTLLKQINTIPNRQRSPAYKIYRQLP